MDSINWEKKPFFAKSRKTRSGYAGVIDDFSTGGGKIDTLADLHRSYHLMAEQRVAYKPIHNQLSKPAFADFMRQTAKYLLDMLAQKSLTTPLEGKFCEFERIIRQEGTSFAVKDALAAVYPGRFHTVSPAAVELHVTYDLLNEKIEAVNLTENTAGERANLPTPAQLFRAL